MINIPLFDCRSLNRCTRLKKENSEIRQQVSSNRSNDQQQQQIELLRQMARASEEALNKERAKTNNTKKTDDYRLLNDQVCLDIELIETNSNRLIKRLIH